MTGNHGVHKHFGEHKSKVVDFWSKRLATIDKDRKIEKGIAETVENVLHSLQEQEEAKIISQPVSNIIFNQSFDC